MKPELPFSALDALLEDGSLKHPDALDRVAVVYPADSTLLLHLVRLAESGESPLQVTVTALLKRYQANGARFSSHLTGRLLELLPAASCWEAKLHLLQMLPALAIPRSHAASVCEHLSGLLTDRNKFIRAWAYGGLHRLASLYSPYRTEVAALLDRASHEESASVRARLRQLPPL